MPGAAQLPHILVRPAMPIIKATTIRVKPNEMRIAAA